MSIKYNLENARRWDIKEDDCMMVMMLLITTEKAFIVLSLLGRNLSISKEGWLAEKDSDWFLNATPDMP